MNYAKFSTAFRERAVTLREMIDDPTMEQEQFVLVLEKDHSWTVNKEYMGLCVRPIGDAMRDTLFLNEEEAEATKQYWNEQSPADLKVCKMPWMDVAKLEADKLDELAKLIDSKIH